MSQQKLLSQIRMPSRPSHYVYPGTTSLSTLGASQVVEAMLVQHGKALPVTDGIDFILSKVFNVDIDSLKLKSRKPEIVFPRQVGMLLLRLSNYSLSSAGGYYLKDHATALHAINKKCFPILETKYPKDDYDNLVCAIRAFHMLYPQYSLSILPRGWDNPYIKIHKPLPGHGEQSRTVSAL